MNNKLNTKEILSGLVLVLLTTSVRGQGTFIYDQQSSDESNIVGSVSLLANPSQSFTPNLSSIEFIRLALHDLNFGNALGATVYVNLRGGSVTGAVLAVSSAVSMPDSFAGVTNFFFSPGVALTPGLTYYFQPVLQSGDGWEAAAYNAYNYPGGMEFLGSTAFPNIDLWFREGVVPEPSTLAVVGVGFGILALTRHFRRNQKA